VSDVGRRYKPEPGSVVADKYVIDAILAEGGMGVVVSATHQQLHQRVAIKFLSSEPTGGVGVARFIQEARIASRIQSDHVVRVIDFGTLPDGVPYMVMEHLTGRDLEDLLDTDGPRPAAEAVDYILQAAEAVAEAHAVGLVHRDLKPANLFCTKRKGGPFIKVLDFGISKDVSTHDLALTSTGQSMGTPFYMSPEQVRDARKVDSRTDIWSLGIILYQLLTGELPFTGNTLGGVFAAIVSDPFVPLRLRRPELPVGLEAAVHRCFERDVSRRFQSVGEFARALEPFAPAARSAVDRIVRVEESPESHVFGSKPTVPPPEQSPGAEGSAGDPPSRLLETEAAARISPAAQTGAAWGKSTASARVTWPVLAAVGALAIAVVVIGAIALVGHGQKSVAAPGPSLTPTFAPADLPSASLPAVAETVAQPPAPPAPSHSAPLVSRPNTRGPAAPAPPSQGHPKSATAASPNCDPPFTLDDQGRKHFKPECYLQKSP